MRSAVIVAVTLALIGGPIAWVTPAAAEAPKPETWGQAPGSRASGTPPIYAYENPVLKIVQELLDAPEAPSPREFNLAGVDPTIHAVGTRAHALAAWNRYAERKKGEIEEYRKNPSGRKPRAQQEFRGIPNGSDRGERNWLVKSYSLAHDNNVRGRANEERVRKALGLSQDAGWKSEQDVKVGKAVRRYDDRNAAANLNVESKAGRIDPGQLANDEYINSVTGNTTVYVLATEPSAKERSTIEHADERLKKGGKGRIIVRVLPANLQSPKPRLGPAPGALVGPEQSGSSGALADVAAASPESAEAAEERAEAVRELAVDTAQPDQATGDLGGVDFATLELRYVADTRDRNGPGATYGFKARATADGRLSYGGEQAVRQASDSFFVWLALRPDQLTVNLNPDEPTRIIDTDLGRTDAGRIMLEADLRLKKTTAKLIHPNTALGAKYWKELQSRPDGTLCSTTRMWITPSVAAVHEDDGQLYILDAPLTVKTESEHLKSAGVDNPVGGCGPGDPTNRHNTEVFRLRILPKIVDAVNKAPEYANLRRVYLSRVAAEWIRERSKDHRTAYSQMINKGDIAQWVSRDPWNPRDIYNRYVKSFKEGEFKVTHKTVKGNYEYTITYIYGGVDFTRVPDSEVGADIFRSKWSSLPSTVNECRNQVTFDSTGGEVWLGGAAPPDPERNGVATFRRFMWASIAMASTMVGFFVLGMATVILILVARRSRRQPAAR